jgi:hypothetical protein
MNNNSENKYPKSKNKFQCLGPCYQPGTTIIHPITLEYITDLEKPFCPVKEWTYEDPATGKKTDRYLDTCYGPVENKDLSGKELELNILTPYIDFNSEQFLKIYYNIYSFEDAIEWLNKKKYVTLTTKLRIVDCAWNAYGKDMTLIDDRIVDFYVDVIKRKWIKEYYKKFNTYIYSDETTIKFIDPEKNTLNINDYIVNRTNFLIEKFINYEEVYKFINKYIKHRKSEWGSIRNHSNNIQNDLSDYIYNKIKLTIDAN